MPPTGSRYHSFTGTCSPNWDQKVEPVHRTRARKSFLLRDLDNEQSSIFINYLQRCHVEAADNETELFRGLIKTRSS